jgi:hypothetical protein
MLMKAATRAIHWHERFEDEKAAEKRNSPD